MMEEEFDGESAALLYAGNALHADLTPDASGSAIFGWMLVGLGQQYGFPVPVGGAGAGSPMRSFGGPRSRGVELRCGQPVVSVEHVGRGGLDGVSLADGTHIPCRVVLADCDVVR